MDQPDCATKKVRISVIWGLPTLRLICLQLWQAVLALLMPDLLDGLGLADALCATAVSSAPGDRAGAIGRELEAHMDWNYLTALANKLP